MTISICNEEFEKCKRLVKIVYASKGLILNEQEIEENAIYIIFKLKEDKENEKKNG